MQNCLQISKFRYNFASRKLKNSINETDRQTDRQFPTDAKSILIVVRYAKESVKQNTKSTFAVDYESVNFVGVARNSKSASSGGGGSVHLRDGVQSYCRST